MSVYLYCTASTSSKTFGTCTYMYVERNLGIDLNNQRVSQDQSCVLAWKLMTLATKFFLSMPTSTNRPSS